jgi:Baseplate J-like protein
MTTYGLGLAGFTRKTYEVIFSELDTKWRGLFGNSIDTSESTPDGQLLRFVAEREAALWEINETLYTSWDPDGAQGRLLEMLCAITGTKRRLATRTAVMLTLTGDNATAVPAGALATITGTEKFFATSALATITTLTSWAPSTNYTLGTRRTNASRCYVCTVAGISAGSGGPATDDDDIADGAAHWRYMGEGVGAVDVLASCTVTGPTTALSSDINEIESQQSGWLGVINLEDADVGQAKTSDQGLRLLREIEVAGSGNSPVPAIRARMSQAPIFATSCKVFYNNTLVTDGDGVPGKSVEVMLEGGDDQDIVDVLFNECIAGGIGTHGNQTGTAVDDEGTSHTIKFTRPTAIPIYIIITVEVDASEVPADVEDLVKANIITYGADDTKNIAGMNVRARRIGAEGIKDIDGVLSFTTCYIGTAPAPASESSIAIALRERASYDTSRITVITTPVTP